MIREMEEQLKREEEKKNEDVAVIERLATQH